MDKKNEAGQAKELLPEQDNGFVCPHCKAEIKEAIFRREWSIDLETRKTNFNKSPFLDGHTNESLHCPECGGKLKMN